MCLLVLALDQFAGCPVLLAANREEEFARPSLEPEVWRDDELRWLGGRDAVAGGAWLGLNERGLLVAVTNRSDRPPPAAARSRGLLCRSLLQCDSVDAALDELQNELDAHDYAGCNLLTASRNEAVVTEFGKQFRQRRLSAGLHVLVNSGLNDAADRRGERARREFRRLLERSNDRAELIAGATAVLGLVGGEDGDPDGVPLCICGTHRGTVSATVLALTNDVDDCEYHFANGPPCRTPFQSHRRSIRELLATRRGGH